MTSEDAVSSATVEPAMTAGDVAGEKYARFGNHKDPLTDYHVEVSLLNSLVNEHLRHGLHDREQLLARIDRAWLNVVQPEWVEIKNRLREIHSALIAPAETPDQGQDQSAPMNTEAKPERESRESGMVTVAPNVFCDPEIVDLIKALNDGGVKTIASCSGHGFRPGGIALADGRWLVIAKDWDEMQKIEALFPIDINGEVRS